MKKVGHFSNASKGCPVSSQGHRERSSKLDTATILVSYI